MLFNLYMASNTKNSIKLKILLMEDSFLPKTSNTENNETDNLFQILGFAKLIQDEVEKRENPFYVAQDQTFDKKESEPISTKRNIRCICNDDNPKNNTDLIQCRDCHNFLHERCMQNIQYDTNNLICPFCCLLERGIDQFTELKKYIKYVEQEIKTVHELVDEANTIEEEYFKSVENKSSIDDQKQKQLQLQAKIQEIYSINETFLNKTINYNDHESTAPGTEPSESVEETNTEDQESDESSEPST